MSNSPNTEHTEHILKVITSNLLFAQDRIATMDWCEARSYLLSIVTAYTLYEWELTDVAQEIYFDSVEMLWCVNTALGYDRAAKACHRLLTEHH